MQSNGNSPKVPGNNSIHENDQTGYFITEPPTSMMQ